MNQPGSDRCRPSGSVAVAVELGDRLFGAIVIDQGFAVGRGGDQCGDGGVVERAWQTTTGFVQPGAGVVGDLSRASDYAEVQGGVN